LEASIAKQARPARWLPVSHKFNAKVQFTAWAVPTRLCSSPGTSVDLGPYKCCQQTLIVLHNAAGALGIEAELVQEQEAPWSPARGLGLPAAASATNETGLTHAFLHSLIWGC